MEFIWRETPCEIGESLLRQSRGWSATAPLVNEVESQTLDFGAEMPEAV